jgi:hypothetical protein
MIDVGSESMPALVDLDGDGDLDLLLANKIDPADRKTSRVYRFENTGDASQPSFRLAGAMDFRGLYHYAPAFGDLDGDGKLDIVMGSFSAKMAWYRSDGTGAAPPLLDCRLGAGGDYAREQHDTRAGRHRWRRRPGPVRRGRRRGHSTTTGTTGVRAGRSSRW